MRAAFTAAETESLRTAGTVRIETRRTANGPVRQTVIWVVVDAAERVLVRSVRGARGRWYRDLLARPDGAVVVGGSRVPILAEHATDPERVAACSAALTAKYPRAGASLASMLAADVLDATLELLRA